MFGCFKITPAGLRILGQTCQHLQTLNIGQCHKVMFTVSDGKFNFKFTSEFEGVVMW